MIRVRQDNLLTLYSETIPYTRVDLSGFLTTSEYFEKLGLPELFKLIREKNVLNILLNFTRTKRFGTEELEWLAETWVVKAAEHGIRKISVVVPGMTFTLFQNLFQSVAGRPGRTAEIRFFHDGQFYEGWEAVAWFDE